MYASPAPDVVAGTPRDYHERTKHPEAHPLADRHYLDWAQKRIYQRHSGVVPVPGNTSLEATSDSPGRFGVQVVVVGPIVGPRSAPPVTRN